MLDAMGVAKSLSGPAEEGVFFFISVYILEYK
jgi:hypothetical protein